MSAREWMADADRDAWDETRIARAELDRDDPGLSGDWRAGQDAWERHFWGAS